MYRRCLGLGLLILALSGSAVAAQREAITLNGHLAHPSRVLAKFRDPAVADRQGAALASVGTSRLQIQHRYELVPGLVVIEDTSPRAPATVANPDETLQRQQLLDRIQALKASGLFEYVEPDYYHHLYKTPTDSAYTDGTLWGLWNYGQDGGAPGADISAAAAWDLTTGTNKVLVAVIDSGIRYTHKELEKQMWKNTGEKPNNNIDDDNNGWVDDVYGINAVANTGDPMDDNNHGTHVSGTIGAAANDGNRHVGVAWNVSLMACKAFDENGFGSTSGEILCIDYAVKMGAKILNNSWGGGPFEQSLFDSIKRCRDAGVLFVAAAGNDGSNNDVTPAYPASYDLDNIISVAAMDRSDNLASFSNRGATSVDLGAPGVEIFSCVAGSDTDYEYLDGTSMAAPHVTGVAALILSYYPNADVDEIRDRILGGAVPVASLNRRTVTGGRLNAYNSLTLTGDGLLQVSVDPPDGSTLLNGAPQTVVVRVRDRFAIRDATVNGRIVGGGAVTFRNDGQAPDTTANDAYYSGRVNVPSTGDSLALVLTVTAPGKVGITNTLSYSLAPRPLNDPFASPTKVPSDGGLYESNSRFATLQPGEPPHGGYSNAVASLWWTYVSPVATNVLVDATGTGFASVLAVYTGNVVSNLSAVASSFTTNAAAQRRVHVFFEAKSGQLYSIALAGVQSNAFGSVRLRIAPGGALQTEPPVVAITTPQSGITVTDNLLTVAGTARDTGPNAAGVTEVLVNLNEGIAAPANGTTTWNRPVALRPGMNKVSVRAVNAAGLLSDVKTIDVRYLIARPANDDFGDASVLSGTDGTAAGDNGLATKQQGEPQHAGNAGGHSLWWAWRAPADGALLLSTEGSTFDTLLGLYTGDLVGSLTTVTSNDDATEGSGFSKIQQAVRAQTLYHIAVDGYNGSTGAVQLAYAFTNMPLHTVQLSQTAGGTTQPAAGALDVVAGSALLLSATPDPGHVFRYWEGDISTSKNPASIPVESDLEIRAVFAPQPLADDFETGDLSRLPWQMSGAAPWYVTEESAASGRYSLRSGAIGDGQDSRASVTLNLQQGTASFSYRVSSEPNWDFLEFYLDGTLVQRWSGEVAWTTYPFVVTAGTHTLEWRYAKDAANRAGADAAFIDNLDLPVVVPPDGTRPTLSISRVTTGGVEIRLQGQTNQTFVLQAAANALGPWQGVYTNQAVGGEIRYFDAASTAVAERYYRAVGP